MNEHKDEKWLDDQLFRAINVGDLQFDSEQWKEKYPQEYETLSSSARNGTPTASVSRQNIWRTIMNNRIINIAAAAVIIITLSVTLIVTLTNDNVTPPIQNNGTIVITHVAWGKVLENIEKIQTLKHRVKLKVDVIQENESLEYDFVIHRSKEFGIRRDAYKGDKLVTIMYISANTNEVFEIIPSEKLYVQGTLSDRILEESRKTDLALMVTELMEMEYIEVGRETIYGIECEGIEFTDPKFGAFLFDSGTGELWVDPQTNLPVLLTAEGDTNDGAVHLKLVVDQFEWSTELTAADFEPDIPADYKLLANIDASGTEESAIIGLKGFAQLCDGKYPSTLAVMSASKEITEALRAKIIAAGVEREPTQQEYQQVLGIQATCLFVAELMSEEKDPAYYGATVTAADADKVLMRWQLDDGNYRVIFGDLHTETVDAQRLAELEGR